MYVTTRLSTVVGMENSRTAENGELLSLTSEHEDEDQDNQKARNGNCGDSFLNCLANVPCAALVAWIILLLGLGGLTGGLVIGAQKTRETLESDSMLWFMEFTIIGVVVTMFVIGTCLLLVCHYSSDPTSRRVFNSTKKNSCARGLNIFILILTYILTICWICAVAVLALPVGLFFLEYILTEHLGYNCINLKNYGFDPKKICGSSLRQFKLETDDLLICYGVALGSAILVIVGLIHFLISISANYTHLRDTRFATLNAYVEADHDEVRHVQEKNSVLDTTM